jgi:hypothetical protein
MLECVKRKIDQEKRFKSEMSGRWKDESNLLLAVAFSDNHMRARTLTAGMTSLYNSTFR